MRGGQIRRDAFQFATLFWSKVQRRGPDECWPWSGARNSRGYGTIGWAPPGDSPKTMLSAHRVAYHLTNGAPPVGHTVMHRCDNPPCCNPAHLLTGTVADNNRDRSEKGRTARPGVGNWNYNRKNNQPRGTNHPQAKLTESDVLKIRELCATRRFTQREIGRMFGVSQPAIKGIHRRETWSHLP